MASINGIEIKGAHAHRGHEGESLVEGNVYKDGKKIALYCESDWGAPTEFYYEKGVELTKDEEDILELTIYHVLGLKEKEKEFKKAIKKGFDSIAIINVNDYSYISYSIKYDRHKAQILAKAKEKKVSEKDVEFYRSLDDFNIKMEIKSIRSELDLAEGKV